MLDNLNHSTTGKGSPAMPHSSRKRTHPRPLPCREGCKKSGSPIIGGGGGLLLLALLTIMPVRAQRLPTGQILRPAGVQVPLGGTLALGAVPISGTPYVVVNCGGGLQALTTVNTQTGKAVSTTAFQTTNIPPVKGQPYTLTGSAWYGLTAHGRTLYAAGGGTDTVHVYAVKDDGSLAVQGELTEPTGSAKQFNFPAGLALNGPGTRLYAANNLSDTLAVWDTGTRRLLGTVPVGGYPLAALALPDSGKVYVACEQSGTVTVVDPRGQKRLRDIRTGSHPDALCLSRDRKRLFVANAGSDTLSIIDTQTDKVLQTVLLRPAQVRGLPGATPTGLALSPDEHTLYVTLADMNAVAVLGVNAKRTDATLRGYVPVGWYPSAVTVNNNGLCVVNAKGSTAQTPNPRGPGPLSTGDPARYVNFLLQGTVTLLPAPDAKTLAAGTQNVLNNNGIAAPLDADAPAVTQDLAALPVKHVLYIIKENRTYDQVFGDMEQGDGNPTLALFGRAVTPNQHALAEQFVLMDNFYCCAEVSADGWNWSTSGFANDYVQRTVSESYGERGKARPQARPYDYEGENRDKSLSLMGGTDVAESPGGYIWDDAAAHGLSIRNYGCFLSGDTDPQSTKPVLTHNTCPDYAPFAMNHADSDGWVTLHLPPTGQYIPKPGEDPEPNLTYVKGEPSRYSAWKKEWDGYVRDGNLPNLEVLRLPRDHTAGTTFPLDSPRAMAADNDYAVGEIAAAVSHSPYWASTAIFVVEDDAQNGPDHVDCHRSPALVISPYTQKGSTDLRFYNTDSMLRTMETLLHLPPMTRLDASAPPLRGFSSTPDLTPFAAILPDPAILGEKNAKTAYGAARSAQLNFRQADAAPDAELNDILWHAIKGANVPLPLVRGGH